MLVTPVGVAVEVKVVVVVVSATVVSTAVLVGTIEVVVAGSVPLLDRDEVMIPISVEVGRVVDVRVAVVAVSVLLTESVGVSVGV